MRFSSDQIVHQIITSQHLKGSDLKISRGFFVPAKRTMEHKTHCPYCGERLTQRFVEGRLRLFCSRCSRPIYENPIPAACLMVINNPSQLLLVQRSVEPQKGLWCLPGGFIELGEDAEEGALRELAEETGLDGTIDTLLGVRTTKSTLYHSVLVICFLVRRYNGCLIPGDDAAKVEWFEYGQLPTIAFDSHRFFIDQFFNKVLQ